MLQVELLLVLELEVSLLLLFMITITKNGGLNILCVGLRDAILDLLIDWFLIDS